MTAGAGIRGVAAAAGPTATAHRDGGAIGLREGLRFGALGAPLAFAALPLYVHLPNHYAATLGAPLAGLGAVLLATRAWDAFTDPWLGRWADAQLGRPLAATWRWAALAGLLMLLGLVALYFPPVQQAGSLLAWCAMGMVVTSLGYSALGVLHQSWSARLGGGPVRQASLNGWREGLALAGVLLASVLPAMGGAQALVAGAAVLLTLGLLALRRAPYPGPALTAAFGDADAAPQTPAPPDVAGTAAGPDRNMLAAGAVSRAEPRVWQDTRFRRLLAVYLVNGVASAVPATLVLFFVADRLQAASLAPAFLGAYFLAAAAAVPLWVRAAKRHGLVRIWQWGMALSVASFIWAASLGAGGHLAFALVCLASGSALGADLVAPGALLAGLVQRAGHGQAHEGRYVGWWTCASKLNLALAAGLALPLLQALGYRPGQADTGQASALVLAYAVLPCMLKLAALALLSRHRRILEST